MPTLRVGDSLVGITSLDSWDEVVYKARTDGLLRGAGDAFRVIDLYAGAGGLTLGFSPAFGHAFVPIWANDIDETAAATYNLNFDGHCVPGDIVRILGDPEFVIPAADVVIGGPPCQGFSLLNRNRECDPRKELWLPFMEVVKRSGAGVFVMENVPQILHTWEHQQIEATAKELGFHTVSGKLCAADYGAPQRRWRAFILGCKFAHPGTVFPPKKTHAAPGRGDEGARIARLDDHVCDVRPWTTVRDAIGDLPVPVGTGVRAEDPPLNLHFGRQPTAMSLERYAAIPEEGMNRFDLQRRVPHLTPACWVRKKSGGTDLFGRLWWDRPAFTIRTEFFKPEKGRYLHPSQHRPITHREAARLQSFPDAFRFCGSKTEIARQIGNAVPPVLAARIADCVYALLALAVREGVGVCDC